MRCAHHVLKCYCPPLLYRDSETPETGLMHRNRVTSARIYVHHSGPVGREGINDINSTINRLYHSYLPVRVLTQCFRNPPTQINLKSSLPRNNVSANSCWMIARESHEGVLNLGGHVLKSLHILWNIYLWLLNMFHSGTIFGVSCLLVHLNY